jgi:outer membrane receptor protein involved in Fe transport
MKKLFTLLALVSFVITAHAQSKNGRIFGSVKNAEGKGVESATVSLVKAENQALVKVSITGKEGSFEFERIPEGKFTINITATGYADAKSGVIEVTAEKNTVDAGSFTPAQASKDLGNVQVTAKRPMIENKIDKTIVNVDASPSNTGLSALEVLEKSPGIVIDNNDNISVKGKSGVIILIDGKQTYLSGQDLANFLRNMPSNQLDQIEIMTQPSAKYDASGNSGIINIKTKKSKANGFNGSINNSMIFANYYKNTSGLNFNWRHNKVNVFGNYGLALWEGFNDIHITRSFRKDAHTPANSYFDQNTFGRFSGYPHNFKLGVDVFASKNTTIGAVVTGNFDVRKFKSDGVNRIYDSLHNLTRTNRSSTETNDPWTNVGGNINFRHILNKKGAEITADADYVIYRTKGNQYSNNYLYNADGSFSSIAGQENPYYLKGYLPAYIDIYTLKSDYTQPFGKNGRLEAGFKLSYVQTDNDARYTYYDASQTKWVNDASRSNHFLYEENINAAYVNIQQQVKKLGIQVGLRMEQTIVKGNQLAQSKTFEREYTKLFPTVYLSYKPTEANTFGLSYGRRIERPGYQDLNPFQYLLDRYTFRQGNPELQPQFSHNIEVSYNYKGRLNISVNYTNTTDIINDVIKTSYEPGNEYPLTFQVKDNVAKRTNIGLSANWNQPIKKWWMINFFTNVYNNSYEGFVNNEKIDVAFTSFNANVSNSFQMGKGWSGEISGFYNYKNFNSSVILAQPMGMFSLGLGKQVMKGKGTVRVNARDPFWLMKFRGSTEMDKFTTGIQSRWDNRRFILSFNFRFGKAQQQQQRKRGGSDEEQNRAGGGQQQG